MPGYDLGMPMLPSASFAFRTIESRARASASPSVAWGGLAMAVLALLAPGCDRTPATPAPARGGSAYLDSLPLQSVDGTIDFGPVKPCGDDVVRVTRIRNTSAQPVEVLAYASNCGCLTAELIGDRTIGPGEERELRLTVHAGGSGDRSIRVEFGSKTGFAGMVRTQFTLNQGVSAVPPFAEVTRGERMQAFEVAIVGNDGFPVKVLSIDPPVGSMGGVEGEGARVSLSSAEAEAFLASEAARTSPAVIPGPGGEPSGLRVTILTDHPHCPVTHFDFLFRR